MKQKHKLILKYIVIFILTYLLCSAQLKGGILPFGLAFILALLASREKGYILAPIYFTANALTSLTLQNTIITVFTSLLILIVSLFHIKNKQIKLPLLIFYLLICYSPLIYFTFSSISILKMAICIVISTIFMVSCVHLFKAILIRGILYRFTIDENMCTCFFIAALFCGIACLSAPYISLFHIISILCVLLGTFFFKESSLVFSAMIGLGYTLANFETSYLGLLTCCCLVALAFKNNRRILSALSVLLIDVIFGLYFNAFDSYNLVTICEALFSCILFVCLRGKWLDSFRLYLSEKNGKLLARDLVNRNRDTLYKKLCELSDVFSEMDNVFKQTVRGVLPIDDAKKMLCQEATNKVCDTCLEKGKCLRAQGGDTNKVIFELFTAGFERGKTTLLDVPPYLTNRCTKINSLLQVINGLILQYKQYATMVNNLDSSRILIAEQLNGVSRIMKTLGSDVKKNVAFDTAREDKLLAELTFNNIICNEVIIYEQDINTLCVSLIVRNTDAENKNIENIVSKICGHKLTITDIVPSKINGWSIINLASSAKYDVVFGYSNKCKTSESISGDTYSLLRLNNNRFMMALCDGMGSGEHANKTSELAINLVENFYRAGFDNDIILSSVNKLLSINNEESYTALDLCVLDLNKNFVDFIKLGSPVGYIKHKTTTDIVQAGALPIGILEEMQPNITKSVLNDGDILILITDGISDAFDNCEKLCNFINNLTSLNPQEIADNILDKALVLSSGIANDDMTVLTCRIFSKQ